MSLLNPALSSPCRSLLSRPSTQIIKLHPLQEILWADVFLSGGITFNWSQLGHSIGGSAIQMRLVPGFCWHGAWRFWGTDCKLFLWMWWEVSRGEDKQEPIEFALSDTAFDGGSEFIAATWGSAVAEVKEAWHHLKLLPNHYDLCLWSAIYRFASPVHRLHLKVGSGLRGPGKPLHFLWIPLEQPPQNRSFCGCPWSRWHRGLCQTSELHRAAGPDIRTVVLPMLTRIPFPSMLVFQRISFSCSSSSDSVMMTMSSAYRLSHGHPVSNSWERASGTMMKSRGLRQESWWTPTWVASNMHSASGMFIHVLYEPHKPNLNAKLAKSPPDDTCEYTIECLFQIDKGHVQCLVDSMELFVV